jgi:hypothetical protein
MKHIKEFEHFVAEAESYSGKFKIDDLVYNKRTKTVGIVRMGDDKYGEVKTDADGNVDVDELEKYNPIKNKHQQNAKAAPSTEKEINSRGLFNPFALEENLKSESIVSEAKELNFEQEWNTLSTHIQHDLLKDIRDKKIADKFAGDFWEKLPHFIQRDLKKELTQIMSESIVSEAKELAWIDKGDPSKEVRVTDDGGYVTIMQKDFEGRVIRVLIDTNQIPQLIAALKKAK